MESQRKASDAAKNAYEKAVKDYGESDAVNKKVSELWGQWGEELDKEDRIEKAMNNNLKK